MNDDVDNLLSEISKITGIPAKPKDARPLKTPAGADVAGVVNDELSKLGWSDNARLSFLGDLGRENAWNRKTIFGGHSDPKNSAFNRGIISWQGDRRTNLDNYLKKQGLLGRNDDDELRGMVRFMDEEMRSNPEWRNVHSAVRNPEISTYDASENLRKYIKYVPDGKYNSYDPEFRVKNNRQWAEKAQRLGIVQPANTDYSDIVGEIEQATEADYNPLLAEIDEVIKAPALDLPADELSDLDAVRNQAADVGQTDFGTAPTASQSDLNIKPAAPTPPTPTVPTVQTVKTPQYEFEKTGQVTLADGTELRYMPNAGEGYTFFDPQESRYYSAEIDGNNIKFKPRHIPSVPEGIQQPYNLNPQDPWTLSPVRQQQTELPQWLKGEAPPMTKIDPSLQSAYKQTLQTFGAKDSEEFRQKFLSGFTPEDDKYVGYLTGERVARAGTAQTRPQTAQPQPVKSEQRYVFEQTGKLKLDSGEELILEKDRTNLQPDEYRFKNKEGKNLIVNPEAKTVLPEHSGSKQFRSENVPIDMTLKPAGVSEMDWVRQQSARAIADKYGIRAIDVEKVLESKDFFNPQGAEATNEFLKSDRWNGQGNIGANVIAEAAERKQRLEKSILAEYADTGELTEEAKKHFAGEGFTEDDLNNIINADTEAARTARAQAEKSLALNQGFAREAADKKLRDEVIDEINKEVAADQDPTTFMNPGVAASRKPELTEEEINRRIADRKASQLTPEEEEAARSKARELESYGLPGNLAQGLFGSGAGSIFRAVAGGLRNNSEEGYRKLQKLANFGAAMGSPTDPDKESVSQSGARMVGDTVVMLARLGLLAKLPKSNAVVTFAADHAMQAAGEGKNFTETARAGAKGGFQGAIFGAASRLSNHVFQTSLANRGATIEFTEAFKGLSPDKIAILRTGAKRVPPEMRSSYLRAQILGEGTRIGTIAAGTYTLERGSGTSHSDALDATAQMVIFDLVMRHGGKVLKKGTDAVKSAAGKVYRVWKDGRSADYSINPDGALIRYEKVPDNFVDGEIVADAPATARETRAADAPADLNATINRGNRIGETESPRELLSENPRRIEAPHPEAIREVEKSSHAQRISEILADGQAYTPESLQKLTRFSRENVENAMTSLYGARRVEMMPDGSIRRLSQDAVQVEKPKTIAERAAEKYQPRTEPIRLNESTLPNEIQTEISKQTAPVAAPDVLPANQAPVPQKVEPSIESITANTYSALPQQKIQEKAPEKEVAKVSFDEPLPEAQKQTVYTERGRLAQIAPKVVDAADLLTSLDEGYPQQFQPRDRSRAASKAQVAEIANRLNPEFLGDSPKASDGRPLVVPVQMPGGGTKYAVISGNGRTAGIRTAYELGKADKYAEFARTKGDTGAQNPVYVGILDPNEIEDFPEFAKESNESSVAQMSAAEQAKSDADRLDASVLNLFTPSEDGSIHTGANRDFIRTFLDRTTSTAERSRFIDAEGKLSQEGVTKVKNAIFAKAFGGSEMGMVSLQRMAESTDSNIKNITNALLSKAGELSSFAEAAKDNRRHKELDIAPDFARAMEKYSELKDSNTSIDEYIQQGTLFGADTSPLQTRVMQVFDAYKRRSKSIKGIIDNYIQAAENIGDPNQQGLFGADEVPSKESIFEGAIKYYEQTDTGEESGEQTGLFAQSEPAARRENSGTIEKVERETEQVESVQVSPTNVQANAETPVNTAKEDVQAAPKKSAEQIREEQTGAPTGDYGQISYKLRNNGFTSDPAVIKAVTGQDSADTTHAVLDHIAKESGVARSSQMSPEMWDKWLDNNADKLTVEQVSRIEDAKSTQEDFNKKISSFVSDKRLSDILDTVDLTKPFKSLHIKTRSDIRKVGKENKLSNEQIERAYDKTVSQAIEGESAGRRGNDNQTSEAASVQSQSQETEQQGTARQEVDRIIETPKGDRFIAKLSGDPDKIKLIKRIKVDEVFTENEKQLVRAIEDVHEANYSDNHLIRFAKTEIRDGFLFVDPRAGEFFNRAFLRNSQSSDSASFHGGYLTPKGHFETVKYLDRYINTLPALLKPKAEKLRDDFIDAADLSIGDIAIIPHSTAVPDGLRIARQEESLHRGDFRVRNFEPLNTQRFLANPAVDEVKSVIAPEYSEVNDDDMAAEVVAKIITDDAKALLGVTEETLVEATDAYYDELLDLGVTLEDLEKHFSGIGNRAEEFIQNAPIRRENFKQTNPGTGSAGNSGNEGQAKVSRFKPVGVISDPPTSQGNTDELNRIRRESVLESARRENELGLEGRSLSRPLQNVNLLRARAPLTQEEKSYLAKGLNLIWKGRGDEATPVKEVITNFRRAGLLTGVKTHLRNVFSNSLNQVSEEAIRPIAILADIVASAKTGQRTVQAPSFPGIAKSFAALVRADKTLTELKKDGALSRAWNILKNGDIKELDKNQLKEMQSGSPVVDAIVNYTFRTLGAEDSLFKTYAMRRSLEESAKTKAITKARKISWKSPMEKLKYIRAQKLEILKNPTNEMLLEAELYADFTTFTNQNPVSDIFTKVKDVNPWLKAGIETVVPYDKTPTNIVARTLEYTPLGLGWAGKHLYDLKKGDSYIFRKMREDRERRYEELDRNRRGAKGLLAEKTIKLIEGKNKIQEEIDRLSRPPEMTAEQKERAKEIREKIDKLFEVPERTIEQSRRLNNLQQQYDKLTIPRERTMREKQRIIELQAQLDRQNKKVEAYQKIKNRQPLKDKFREEDRARIDAAMDELFPRITQQMFARSVGRAGLGSSALGLGIYLAMSGLLSGVLDADEKDEKSEFFERRDKGILNGSIALGSRRYVINDTPLGKVMSLGASIFERGQKPLKKDQTKTSKLIGDVQDVGTNLITEQPLLNSMNEYFGKDKSIEKRIGGLLGSWVPTIMADVADISDNEARDNANWYSGVMNRTPILREYNEKSKFPREPYLRDRANRVVNKLDPFNSRPATAVPIMTKEAKQKRIESLKKVLESTKSDKVREAAEKKIAELEKK